jgi:hypothetical protein
MVRSLSAIEAAKEFWGSLPGRLQRAADLLAHARERGELTDSALAEHMRIVESGLVQLGGEATAAGEEATAAEWLARAARVFEISGAVVGRAVALKCSLEVTALLDLELVAYELEILRGDAIEVLRTLAAIPVRGAA